MAEARRLSRSAAPAVNDGLTPALLDSWPALDALATEWTALLERSRENTLFLSWPWLQAWRHSRPAQVEPFVLTLRDSQGQLQAIAPLYRSRLQLAKTLEYRTLRILGDAHSGAEYPDFIVNPEHADALKQTLCQQLEMLRGHWDCLWLPNIGDWRPGAESLYRALDHCSGLDYHRRSMSFSAVTLPDNAEGFVASLSKSLRTNIRQTRRKLSRAGKLTFRRCQTQQEVEEYLEALFALHRKHWQSKGQPGSFVRHPGLADFYHQFVPRALDEGWLRLYRCDVDNTPRAIQLGYCYGNSFHAIQEGYDPDFLPGTGQVLRAHIIEECIDEGLEHYDFLGAFSNHKRRWQAGERTGSQLFAWNANLRNRLFRYRPLWPGGRFLR